LPEGINGFVVDVKDSCGDHKDYTFVVNGPQVLYAGVGDLHDTRYDDLVGLHDFSYATLDCHDSDQEYGRYMFYVYPSKDLENAYLSHAPYLYATAVLCVFLLTCTVFSMYDHFVYKRQQKVLSAALRTTKIVKSLFPDQFGDRMLQEAAEQEARQQDQTNKPSHKQWAPLWETTTKKHTDGTAKSHNGDPLADYFTDSTVLFCDISHDD